MTTPGNTLDAIKAAKAEIEVRARRFVTAIAVEIYRRVVLKTPVDTGRARMNWNIGVGAPDLSVTDATTKGIPMGKASSALAEFQMGDAVYITNNLPYIRVLEFGEYPDPVKRGSWVKGVGWVKKSEGGFSKQAPVGMVGVTIAEVTRAIPAVSAALGMTGGNG